MFAKIVESLKIGLEWKPHQHLNHIVDSVLSMRVAIKERQKELKSKFVS